MKKSELRNIIKEEVKLIGEEKGYPLGYFSGELEDYIKRLVKPELQWGDEGANRIARYLRPLFKKYTYAVKDYRDLLNFSKKVGDNMGRENRIQLLSDLKKEVRKMRVHFNKKYNTKFSNRANYNK